MTPTLSTQSLVLRPLRKATQEQADWLNDPRNVQYSEQRHNKHTRQSCQRFINECEQNGNHIWGIHTVALDEHIGNIVAYIDQINNIADMSILVHHEHWGKGYATEAWGVVAHWLLVEPAMRKLEAGCAGRNIGMRQVMHRTKFWLEGSRPLHFQLADGPDSLVFYGKFP